MKRRIFLAAMAGAAGTLGWRYHRSKDADGIADIVYKRLGYLQLDDAGVRQFSRDFAARRVLSSRRLRSVATLWPLYRRIAFTWNGRWADRINYAEERIVSFYLISTDFFTNGSDQSRTVHYLGFYDAMLHACANPFRRAVQVSS